jgi:hypothetical protein
MRYGVCQCLYTICHMRTCRSQLQLGTSSKTSSSLSKTPPTSHVFNTPHHVCSDFLVQATPQPFEVGSGTSAPLAVELYMHSTAAAVKPPGTTRSTQVDTFAWLHWAQQPYPSKFTIKNQEATSSSSQLASLHPLLTRSSTVTAGNHAPSCKFTMCRKSNQRHSAACHQQQPATLVAGSAPTCCGLGSSSSTLTTGLQAGFCRWPVWGSKKPISTFAYGQPLAEVNPQRVCVSLV